MKKYMYLAVLWLALLTNSITRTIDPNWCGNKYKNLTILQDALQGNPDVAIPPFICIPTGRVEQFLRQEAPEIFDLYAEVTRRLNDTRTTAKRTSYLRTVWFNVRHARRYSLEELIAEIQSAIKRSFEKAVAFNLFPFTADENNFFTSVANQGRFLMVRSTGVEDNPNVANAGGNVSVAYVDPTLPTILNAMAEVIASYFGLQSLKNRIAGGEVLSANELTIPVLIQELVGEPLGGTSNPADIPVSGVAYTTNQNLSDDTFAITEIDATYGHGEGVVANKVIADRYFLTPSHTAANTISLYPMLYQKTERLIPSQDHSLILIKNSPDLAHKSALSQEQIFKLYHVLKQIERSYKQPMDVEFIVTPAKIYVVQARPAMHKPAEPSYIALDKINPSYITPPIPSIVLVPGTGAVKIITDPKDVIVTKTLDEADQMFNSFSAHAVIVDTWASSLSHAAVNFMSHGTPCVYIQNIDEVTRRLNAISPAQPLIVDTQRQVVFFWENRQQSIQNFIVRGWFEHPIERTLSLFMNNAPVLQEFNQPMPKDAALITMMQQLKTAADDTQQKDLLTKIDTRIKQLINLTEQRIKTTQFVLNPQSQEAFPLFKKTYADLIEELRTAITNKASHFEFLFYHKMLEALLYQVHEAQKVLAGYTYSYFLNEIFEQQQLQNLLKKKNIVRKQALSDARYCPTKELAQKWTNFIVALENISLAAPQEFNKKVAIFDKFLQDLRQSNNLPLWFATSFYQASNQPTITAELVTGFIDKIAAEYTSQAEQFLHNLILIQADITSLEAQKGPGFATAAAARNKWRVIQEKIIKPLTDTQFIAAFNQAPLALKLIASTLMYHAVDILDSTIKELKVSIAIPMQERITIFKEMIADFYNVFGKWVQEVMPEHALVYHSSLYIYLRQMADRYVAILANSNNESMFQRSANFAVNAAVLGSGTAFERHYPETAEDLFMLIHQNTLAALAGTVKSLFTGQPLSQLIYLPPALETYRVALESNTKINIQWIGITYTASEIKLSYNIPLQNHSGTLQLIYNTIINECQCAVQFLGESRDRWEQVALLANISPQLSGLKLGQSVQFDRNAGIVSWSWIIEKEQQISIIIDYLSIMGHRLSFGRNLELENLFELYRGTNRNVTIKNILQNYLTRSTNSSKMINVINSIIANIPQ